MLCCINTTSLQTHTELSNAPLKRIHSFVFFFLPAHFCLMSLIVQNFTRSMFRMQCLVITHPAREDSSTARQSTMNDNLEKVMDKSEMENRATLSRGGRGRCQMWISHHALLSRHYLSLQFSANVTLKSSRSADHVPVPDGHIMNDPITAECLEILEELLCRKALVFKQT